MVLFTSVAAPVAKVVAMTYVLAGLRLRRPWRHLRQVFAWIEWLRPWSMVEVYLLGVFVAYVKLIDLVHIELGVALYALCALMLTMVAADAVLDRQAVWEALDRAGHRRRRASRAASGRRPGRARSAARSAACSSRPAGRPCALPPLRRASACAQAEQHRPRLGADDRGRHPLRAGEHLSRC